MARIYATDPSNFAPTPPFLDRLEQYRNSAEKHQFWAHVSAHLASTAPSAELALHWADSTDMSARETLALERLAIAAIEGVVEWHSPDSEQAESAYAARREISAAIESARLSSTQATNHWWNTHGR